MPPVLKILYKRLLKQLSSLPLAIGELLLIAALSSVGTLIEQNKPASYYADLYPNVGPKVRDSALPIAGVACRGNSSKEYIPRDEIVLRVLH